jgi:ABC-type antimicrobial peptide transport system permease subunit
MVIGGGTVPVIAGILVGLGGAAGLTKFMQTLLFQTAPLEPANLAAVCALFLSVALLACFVPAWRASRVDPVTALRQD